MGGDFLLTGQSRWRWLVLAALVGCLLGWAFGIPREQGVWERPSISIEKKQVDGIEFAQLPDGLWMSVRELSFADLGLDGGDAAWTGSMAAANSQLEDTPFRLPTADEWVRAAGAGASAAPYAWGWGEPPKDVVFDQDTARKPSEGHANAYGLLNMSGNLAEWCSDGTLRGGAWSERDVSALRIDHVVRPDAGYADADAGLRVVWDGVSR